jgi:predicted RNA methylase
VVTNESVVLDIGSGTSGLLAMMAARLGARRVFTAESNEVVCVVVCNFTTVALLVRSSEILLLNGQGLPLEI